MTKYNENLENEEMKKNKKKLVKRYQESLNPGICKNTIEEMVKNTQKYKDFDVKKICNNDKIIYQID